MMIYGEPVDPKAQARQVAKIWKVQLDVARYGPVLFLDFEGGSRFQPQKPERNPLTWDALWRILET